MEIRQTETYARWYARLKDRRARMRINIRIRRLSLGNFGDVKRVGRRVAELRIPYGPGYRVYFTRRGPEVILLLVGGDKSTQRRDIERARELAKALGDDDDE
ncbi:MAG: type II toxin-antitoxin system RelE/ParE family toxin [Spirochaetota bacterium]